MLYYGSLPDQLVGLWWPRPPTLTKKWDADIWYRYILSMCVCPNCPTAGGHAAQECERPTYKNPRRVEPTTCLIDDLSFQRGVYQTRCSSCAHTWGRPQGKYEDDPMTDADHKSHGVDWPNIIYQGGEE